MIESLKPYPEYQESGVRWLGSLPRHWVKGPGFAAFREKCVKNTGMQEKKVLSLSYGRIVVKPLNKLHGLVPASFETYQIVDPGDIIIRSTDLQNDWTSLRVGLVRDRGIITSAYLCFRTTGALIPEYGHLVLHTLDLMKVFYGMGSGLRQNLDFSDFKRALIFVPPSDEQVTIVRFLDHANRRIAYAIQAKTKLITLLNEQKQAIIHRAVTRGLNASVPLKPSGIRWLGDIPEHWRSAVKLKYISSLKGRLGWQGLKAGEYTQHGPYVVSSAHFKNQKINWDKCPHVTQERYDMDINIKLSEGDILLMKDGAAMGKLAFVDHLPGAACLNSHVLLFRPLVTGKNKTYDPRYMLYFMLTAPFQNYVQVNGTGATLLGISQWALANYKICLPPIDEQHAIAHYIDTETAGLDKTISVAEAQITFLHEYRTRLAADVVTGKVDVREAASNLPEEEPETLASEELIEEEELEPEDIVSWVYDRTRRRGTGIQGIPSSSNTAEMFWCLNSTWI
jgi:type I restriction enzyme, S subunit